MSSTASDQLSEAEPSSDSASPAIGSPPASRFPVVGIGASAGGLDAFKQLLLHLPATTGMAFIFVQHLDPRHESILPDLLAEATSMPVHRALDGMPLNPNHVYVIPPNSIVTVVGGNLSLTPRPDSHRLFMPVDYLLRSLANDLGLRSIGVILSGGGTNGTLGIQAIKAAEGITFAQTEETAAHDSMPRCAVLSGSIDYVLSPAGIADELNRIGRHPYLDMSAQVRGVKQAEAVDERELRKLFSLIQSHTGVDFSGYKRNTILRRVIRRMTIRRLDNAPDYVHLLETDPDERTALYQDFLIRVTSFFRDPESFSALEQKVLSMLARDQSADSPIRIWVAGCSTGEEVYSIAMSLIESLGDHGRTASIKILATDIDHQALDVARAG